MKHIKALTLAGAAFALVATLTTTAIAGVPDAGGEVSRKLFAEHKDSVLWLSVVAKISFTTEGATDAPMNIPDQERKLEGYATVISKDGLVVAALSSIDPSRAISGQEIQTRNGGRVKLDASVTLKEVQLIMPDGLEVPAEVVMKDVDLDLAFIRAKADSKQFKDAKFVPIDLKDSAKAVMAEETITLQRGDEVLNRQPAVVRGQVTVLISKPREFVRVPSASPGTPTYNTDGKLLGIGTVRIVQGKPPVPVVLPAADVVELAEQAKTAKAKPEAKAEKKSEEAKPEEKKDSK